MAEKLAPENREQTLSELEGWAEVDGRDAISKTFKFKNFNEAFAFMTQSAMQAEKLNHHPEWSNVYNSVDVTLTTHSENGLTDLDVKMARFMNKAST